MWRRLGGFSDDRASFLKVNLNLLRNTGIIAPKREQRHHGKPLLQIRHDCDNLLFHSFNLLFSAALLTKVNVQDINADKKPKENLMNYEVSRMQQPSMISALIWPALVLSINLLLFLH